MAELNFGHPTRLIERILATGGIAGVIAIMIAGVICFRYATHGTEPIPDVLSHAFTTILGFYFGTTAVAAGRASARHEEAA